MSLHIHSVTGEIRHPAIPPFLCKVRLQADDPRVDDDEYPSTFGSTRASSDKPLKSLKSLTCRFVRLLQKALARSLKLYKEHAGSSCRENSLLRLVKVAYVRFDVSTWRAPSEASYSCCMVWCSVLHLALKLCVPNVLRFSEALQTSDIDALCQSAYFKGKMNQNESNIVKQMSKQTKRHGNCSF